jgi:GH24 family phage-related lysozyme (muramidase)
MKKVFVIGGMFLVAAVLIGEILSEETAISFIIKNEGYIPISKWDNSQFTWGYGTKAPRGGLLISRRQAMEELVNEVEKIDRYLINLFGERFTSLSEGRKTVLIDIMFNVGPLDVKFPKLTALVKKGDSESLLKAVNELSTTSSNPKDREGLRKRSERRKALWLKG